MAQIVTPKASIWLMTDSTPFLVRETPHEVAEKLEQNRDKPLVDFILANPYNDMDTWNGKPIFINPRHVLAVSPPLTAATINPEEE